MQISFIRSKTFPLLVLISVKKEISIINGIHWSNMTANGEARVHKHQK